MASVERAMAKAAASLLPGLLPTPERSSTITPCLVILPSSFASKPKPGRADSVQRWDAHKKDREPGSPTSSCGSSSSTGRASACERWDMNKKCGNSSSSSSSSTSSSSSRASSALPGRASSYDSGKRPPSRASSTDRWDTHKKARSAQVETTAMVPTAPVICPVFSGSSVFASPEPSMLPMPTFFRSRGPGMMPVPAH